jgi:hypothetical protein
MWEDHDLKGGPDARKEIKYSASKIITKHKLP